MMHGVGRSTTTQAAAAGFLVGEGEMAGAIRAHGWSETLGPPALWPQPLKTLIGLMLACPQPMFMAWGPDRIWLYNDAFIPILGTKHPGALGRPAIAEVWVEARAVLAPLFDRVFAGEPVHMQDIALELDRHGRLEEAHFAFSYTPVRDEQGSVVGLFGSCIETTAQLLAERREVAARERQRRQFEQAPGFIIIMHGPDHLVEFVNNTHRSLFESYDWVGRPIRDAFPGVAGQGFFELLDQVYESGETYAAHEAPVRFPRGADGNEETRYLNFIYAPTMEESGEVSGIFCEGFDVTEARKLDEQRRLLTRELEHRMKNVMAMVAAIVNQSFRGADSMPEVQRAIGHRISALGHAHDILTRASWTSAPIRAVVEGALAPHQTEANRFLVEGPDILLAPKPALSLSLVINELATNAVKYGALSVPGGQVELRWRVTGFQPDAIFRFDWRERGGPPAKPPARLGFGLRLIERSLADDFAGTVGIEFPADGMHCFAETPLTLIQRGREPNRSA